MQASKMKSFSSLQVRLILFSAVLISTFMHLPHFNKELMDAHVWRQTQTQTNINNFFEEDMNILNPRKNERENGDGIFRMEFPLMQWMVAAQYKVFGKHLMITRIFMFLVGLLAVFGMFYMLKALFQNSTIAVFGAWAFNFSPAFYYYTINPLPDVMSLTCSIWGLACFFKWLNNHNKWLLFLCGLLLSAATLCKLPYIIFYALPFAYFIRKGVKQGVGKKVLFESFLTFALALLPIGWYLWVIPQWQGNMVVQGMLNNKDGTGKTLEYITGNIISTVPELLLNYAAVPLFIAGIIFFIKNKTWTRTLFMPLALLSLLSILYYLFEANAIALHHDYYLFPFYHMLFILVAYGAYQLYQSRQHFIRHSALCLLLLTPVTCYIRMHKKWNPETPGFNKDLLIYKDELRNVVPNDALVVAGNDVSHYIFLYYIDKKGWAFDSDYLTLEMLEMTLSKGAKYLITDSKPVASNPEILPYLSNKIAEYGSIQVFELTTPKR